MIYFNFRFLKSNNIVFTMHNNDIYIVNSWLKSTFATVQIYVYIYVKIFTIVKLKLAHPIYFTQ